MLQVVYVLTDEYSDNDGVTVVYISLVLTVISIILAIVNEISHICKFKYQTIATCDITIQCNKFKYHHAFCHSKLEKCLMTLFNLSDNQWKNHRDISFEFEVYHIDNEVSTSHTLIIYFKVKLFNANASSHLVSNISRQVKAFMQSSMNQDSPNFHVFQTVCALTFAKHVSMMLIAFIHHNTFMILILQAVCKVLKMKEKVQVIASNVELREIGQTAHIHVARVNSESDMVTSINTICCTICAWTGTNNPCNCHLSIIIVLVRERAINFTIKIKLRTREKTFL